MTAVPRDPKISELRELFKYLQEFRSTYEETGLDEISTPFGNTWSLWDLEYLYRQCSRLTIRQQQAITLCLVHGMKEKDAALAMGVSETNPVMMYATLGLRRLLDLIEAHELDQFRVDGLTEHERRMSSLSGLHQLAGMIKSNVRVMSRNCWLLSGHRPGDRPRIRVRTPLTSSGVMLLDPVRIMYEAHIRSVPRLFTLSHPSGFAASGCVNHDHMSLVMTDEGKRTQARLYEYYVQTRRP